MPCERCSISQLQTGTAAVSVVPCLHACCALFIRIAVVQYMPCISAWCTLCACSALCWQAAAAAAGHSNGGLLTSEQETVKVAQNLCAEEQRKTTMFKRMKVVVSLISVVMFDVPNACFIWAGVVAFIAPPLGFGLQVGHYDFSVLHACYSVLHCLLFCRAFSYYCHRRFGHRHRVGLAGG